MFRFNLRWAVVIAAVALMIAAGVPGRVFAQDAPPDAPPPPPPACVPDEVTACVNLVFFPATLVGDLVLVDKSLDPAVETPTPQVQQGSLWVTFTNPAPGMSVDVVVKNIHDGGEFDTVLYMYPDIAQKVTVPLAANTTKTVTLSPVKKYIRGRVDAKCSPQSVLAGEDVGCVLTLDGTPVEGVVPAGQIKTFYLDAGKHTIQFDLVGATMVLWSPASQVKTPTVYAGSYTNVVTATFVKANHLLAKLSVADWVGDWYVDGVLIAPQAPALDLFVVGNKSHKIEVKNVWFPGSPLLRPYSDATRSFYAAANGTSNVTVTLSKTSTSLMKNISAANNSGTALKSSDYLTWWPAWSAQSVELVEANADLIVMGIFLDGQFAGDATPYRAKAFTSPEPDGTSCGDPAWVPCYSLVWKIPLGRVPPGQHVIRAETQPIPFDMFTGFEVIPAGYYFWWEEVFSVVP